MDIHVNVYGAKVKPEADGNVRVSLMEVMTKNKIVAHLSVPTAQALRTELNKVLKEKGEQSG